MASLEFRELPAQVPAALLQFGELSAQLADIGLAVADKALGLDNG